ncbi:MarR family transcriptional regulator [Candidatus Woesearchaeota archaeon]|nr:MarR family transcriptional regulator [Candidatus Woesearchaeota archaeon]
MVAGGIPKSCRVIVGFLGDCGEKGSSQEELVSCSGLSRRTVKYALRRLRLLDLVYEQVILSDTRRKVYFLRGDRHGPL